MQDRTVGGIVVVVSGTVPAGESLLTPPLRQGPLETREDWLARLARASFKIVGAAT